MYSLVAEFPHEHPGGTMVVNNVRGVPYHCKRCEVTGVAGHETILRCWCCSKDDKLRTRNQMIGSGFNYRAANDD